MINILEYQYGSDKGSAINGQTFASPLAYQGMNESYSSSYVDGEVLTPNAEGNLNVNNLMYQPYKKGTLLVMDAAGTVKETSVDEEGNILGAAEGDLAYYRYNNEQVPVNAPKIKLDIKSLPVETRSRKLSAIWSFDA